jgi:bifunctional UDP-N-acetylglucosamine pyrophosphorylase/glucosamine-1-phosphate N-acetyltransferase
VQQEISLGAIILAAGKGTRMCSPLPKVLHKIGGRPLLGHVMASAAEVVEGIAIVLSPEMPEAVDYCRKQSLDITFAYQQEQLGTAHAVLAAQAFIEQISDAVLIMLGDVPFITPATLNLMLDSLKQDDQIVAVVLAMHESKPNTYGRLVLNKAGHLERIVEVKEASADEKQITLCNSGFFAVKTKYLLSLLKEIQPSPQTGEYYLTDIVAVAHGRGLKVAVVTAEDTAEGQGINTQVDLARAEHHFQQQRRLNAMLAGVTLIDPSSVYFAYDTKLAPGITIHPQVVFGQDVKVDTGVEILSFSHLEGVHIKANAKIGPFARIRPLTTIEENARVGNFVEIKNAVLGEGSKANHLTYVGDADVGRQCNIGAGTITVNYDGVNKSRTTIEDKAFVGSNSSLIAPITIGEGSMVAAGSTVTKNVAKDALAFGRARQVELTDGAKRLRQSLAVKKAQKQG